MYKAFALVVGILRNSLTKQQQKMLLVQRFSFSLFSTYELEVILFEPLTLNPRSVNRYVLQRFCNRWALRGTGQYRDRRPSCSQQNEQKKNSAFTDYI